MIGLFSLHAFWLAPRAALERAEHTLLRRASTSFVDEASGDRFFFVSNRLTDADRSDLDNAAARVRGDSLSFGAYNARVVPFLSRERILGPTRWFNNIALSDTALLAERDFIAELRAQVEASPQRSVLVIVQGLMFTLPESLRHSAFMARKLDIDTPMVLFDWPGNQGSLFSDYHRGVRIARDSGPDLAQMLELIVDQIAPDKIWIMTYSMGAEPLLAALEVMHTTRPDFRDPQPEIDHIALIAADADHTALNTPEVTERMLAITRRMTVYVSGNDIVLGMSRLANLGGKRLGQSSLSFDGSVNMSYDLDPNDFPLTILDVTPVNRSRNFHNFGFESAEFYDDLFLRFTTTELPLSRRLYALRNADGRVYWVLSGR